jgi:hypothetical protein
MVRLYAFRFASGERVPLENQPFGFLRIGVSRKVWDWTEWGLRASR